MVLKHLLALGLALGIGAGAASAQTVPVPINPPPPTPSVVAPPPPVAVRPVPRRRPIRRLYRQSANPLPPQNGDPAARAAAGGGAR